MTNNGFKDNGLIFINNVCELLQFGVNINHINNNKESISKILKAFQDHSNKLVSMKADEFSLKLLDKNSKYTLRSLMDSF